MSEDRTPLERLADLEGVVADLESVVVELRQELAQVRARLPLHPILAARLGVHEIRATQAGRPQA